MVRPSDWSALDLGSDPTPGDPDLVRGGGNNYIGIANAISNAAATLRNLDAGASQAQSVQALLTNRDDMVGTITKAEGRYRTTGTALVTYAGTLDRVQSDTYHALLRAREAAADLATATSMADHYGDQAAAVTDPSNADEKTDYETKQKAQQQAATAAQGKIATEQGIVSQAITERDQAATTAIQAIHDITEGDGLNDSWWDNWGAKLTEWIAKIAEAISTIAGILALLVCWIPVIGQALAGILLIVAAVAAVIAALANIALAATGKKSWGEALLSIAMAALSCVGLGGAGKAGALMFKAMMKQAGKMAGKESGSALGLLGMKTLLRPGAISRMMKGGNFSGIKGALGEEIIGVKAFATKGKFQVFDPKTGLTRNAAEPDFAMTIFGKTAVADAKNVASQSLTSQMREYANLATLGKFQLFVNGGTKLSGPLMNHPNIAIHTFESILGLKIGAVANLPSIAVNTYNFATN